MGSPTWIQAAVDAQAAGDTSLHHPAGRHRPVRVRVLRVGRERPLHRHPLRGLLAGRRPELRDRRGAPLPRRRRGAVHARQPRPHPGAARRRHRSRPDGQRRRDQRAQGERRGQPSTELDDAVRDRDQLPADQQHGRGRRGAQPVRRPPRPPGAGLRHEQRGPVRGPHRRGVPGRQRAVPARASGLRRGQRPAAVRPRGGSGAASRRSTGEIRDRWPSRSRRRPTRSTSRPPSS